MGRGWSADDLVGLDRESLHARPGAKWQSYGSDVLPMWVADMDFPVSPMVRSAIEDHLATGDMGYPARSLKEEVAAVFAERMSDKFGWEIDPSDVRVNQDVIQAMQAVLFTCTEPGDGVVLQTPIYHPFINTITDMGRPLVDNPWIPTEGGWAVDLDGLRSTLASTPARAMILCNPHNPTGRVYSRDELLGIGELAVEHKLVVIADEIHAELIYDDAIHVPFASLSDEIANQTITLTAASKAFNLAGLKMAVAHTTSQHIAEKFDALPGHMFGGNNTFGMKTTLACWRDGQEWLDAVVARLESNRRLLGDLLVEHIPGVIYHKPQGTYLAWMDFSAVDLGGIEPAKYFLENAKVGFNPGRVFGEQGALCCRMNFATGPEIVEEAVERMAAAL